MKLLTLPMPLNPRHFHSKQAVEDYNAAVAEFLAQQEALEYSHSKSSKRKHPSRREQYEQN